MPASSPDPATGSSPTTGAGPAAASGPTRSSGPTTGGRPGPTEGSGPATGASRVGAGRRVITAATGSELHCRGWPQEAAWRMLHNNLDPAVAERPEDLVVYGGGRQSSQGLAQLRRHLPDPARAGRRRNAAGAVRPPGRRPPDPRMGAAGADRQQQPGRRVGQLGRVPAAGAPRAHHVRADDRRIMDLHRHPGDPAGHLRDVRRHRRSTLRRVAGGHAHDHRRRRRHGRRPAPRRHHERRGGHLRRRRPHPPATAARDPLLRRDRRGHRRGHPTGPPSPIRSHGPVDRGGRQRGRAARALRRAQRSGRHRHRPDARPRPDDVRPAPPLGRRGGRTARSPIRRST